MITREQYETLSKNYLELKEKYAKLKNKANVIPKNATNGDMIKAMFPNAKANIFVKEVGVNGLDTYSVFTKKWWNAPYKAEGEVKE